MLPRKQKITRQWLSQVGLRRELVPEAASVFDAVPNRVAVNPVQLWITKMGAAWKHLSWNERFQQAAHKSC